MGQTGEILKTETRTAAEVAWLLTAGRRRPTGFFSRLSPRFWPVWLRHWRERDSIRKNLLYTKKLAFDAAGQIAGGRTREGALGEVDRKTREVLRRETQGFYTEKVRRRQLQEIELLVVHYLRLLGSGAQNYRGMVTAAYKDREDYLVFLAELAGREGEVIQAAVDSVRKASKKDRLAWFRKVAEAVEAVRAEELDRFFPSEGG
ncbi:MAG: NF038143 family protein [Thermodesulfobacteriota bacterium]